eukprot:3731037-Pleurochrysis_carterae.AAC.3
MWSETSNDAATTRFCRRGRGSSACMADHLCAGFVSVAPALSSAGPSPMHAAAAADGDDTGGPPRVRTAMRSDSGAPHSRVL